MIRRRLQVAYAISCAQTWGFWPVLAFAKGATWSHRRLALRIFLRALTYREQKP